MRAALRSQAEISSSPSQAGRRWPAGLPGDSGWDEDLKSSSTNVVVRDSRSKQLDSDRLAADVLLLSVTGKHARRSYSKYSFSRVGAQVFFR